MDDFAVVEFNVIVVVNVFENMYMGEKRSIEKKG